MHEGVRPADESIEPVVLDVAEQLHGRIAGAGAVDGASAGARTGAPKSGSVLTRFATVPGGLRYQSPGSR